MNISSVVLTINKAHKDTILQKIPLISGCEIAGSNDEKIVVLIECQSLKCELKNYKLLGAIDGVIDISMIYSYQDLDDEIQKANNNDIEKIMQKVDQMDAKDVVYNGNLKHI